MTVRRATLADAGRIAEVHVRSWQAGYRGLIPQHYLDSLEPSQRLARRVEWIAGADWSAGGCLVAVDGAGQIAGFADVGRTRDPASPDDLADLAAAAGPAGPAGPAAGTGEVRAIYLAPDAWGQGLGRELMAASRAHLAACGYDQVTLWVLESNARARRFCAAAGFEPDGGRKVDESHGFALAEVRYRRRLP